MNDWVRSVLSELTTEEIVELLRREPAAREVVQDILEQTYPSDPVEFAEKILGAKLWSRQAEILRSLVERRSVVVETGHGVGKSFAAAIAAIWFLASFEDSIVITLAPTANLVQNILWRKIRELFSKSLKPLPGRVLDTPRWEIGANWFGIGISPKRERIDVNEFTAAQGFHADRLLVILDEAGGLPASLFESAESLVTSANSRLLAIGNPIGESGPFYDATISSSYKHIRISCLEHPNVQSKQDLIPGAVSYQWVLDRFERWATECDPTDPEAVQFDGRYWRPSGILRARVLGVPPRESDMGLVSLAWLNKARLLDLPMTAPWVLGVDPAHGGEARSTFAIRAGGRLVGLTRRDFDRTEQIGEHVLLLCLEYPTIETIVVDSIGVGAGVVDWLRERGANVRAVNVTSSARKPEHFQNLRAELFWRLREALKAEKLALPPDDMLDQELASMRYEFDSKGRIAMEAKKNLASRIGRSPDSADALALTFFVQDEVAGTAARSSVLAGVDAASRWTAVAAPRSVRRWRPH
jgi:hypothetical protein